MNSNRLVINGVELGWKAREIVSVVARNGGECTTRDVRDETKIEKTGTVSYWVQKLEQAELIESREGEWDRKIPAPKELILTETGQTLWDDGEIELNVEPGDENMRLEDRVERVEKQIKRRRETYGKMRNRVGEFDSEVSELEKEINELWEVVEILRDEVEGDDGVGVETEMFEFE